MRSISLIPNFYVQHIYFQKAWQQVENRKSRTYWVKVKGGSEAGLVVLADPGVLLPLRGVLYPLQSEQSGHLQGLLTQENYTYHLITTSLSNTQFLLCVMQSIVTTIFRDVQTWKNPSMNTVIMSARTPDVPNSLTSILGRYNNSRILHYIK